MNIRRLLICRDGQATRRFISIAVLPRSYMGASPSESSLADRTLVSSTSGRTTRSSRRIAMRPIGIDDPRRTPLTSGRQSRSSGTWTGIRITIGPRCSCRCVAAEGWRKNRQAMVAMPRVVLPMQKIDLLRAALVGVGVLVGTLLASIPMVAVYAHLINPGQPQAVPRDPPLPLRGGALQHTRSPTWPAWSCSG